jgi:hypothetical protein
VFDSKLSTKPAIPDSLSARARDASNAAAQTAQSAAQTAQSAAQTAQSAAQTAALSMGSAAQTAAHEMGRSMRQGVYVARGWAAPRLENAADYCTATVAPRVADTLRTTARQVSPDDATKRRPTLRSVLSVSALGLAAAAAAAAVAVLVRRQYKAAMDADTEGSVDNANVPDVSVPEQPTAPGTGSTANGSTTAPAPGTATDVNEQASKSGL